MITKKRNKYYCEFCKKAGGAAWAIIKHEERCTLNPNRHCGCCDILEAPQPDLAGLISMLPNPKEYEDTDAEFDAFFYRGLEEAVDAILPKLREACNNCPACIMAALRQNGIPVPVAKNFDFKGELQSILNDYNASKMGY